MFYFTIFLLKMKTGLKHACWQASTIILAFHCAPLPFLLIKNSKWSATNIVNSKQIRELWAIQMRSATDLCCNWLQYLKIFLGQSQTQLICGKMWFPFNFLLNKWKIIRDNLNLIICMHFYIFILKKPAIHFIMTWLITNYKVIPSTFSIQNRIQNRLTLE